MNFNYVKIKRFHIEHKNTNYPSHMFFMWQNILWIRAVYIYCTIHLHCLVWHTVWKHRGMYILLIVNIIKLQKRAIRITIRARFKNFTEQLFRQPCALKFVDFKTHQMMLHMMQKSIPDGIQKLFKERQVKIWGGCWYLKLVKSEQMLNTDVCRFWALGHGTDSIVRNCAYICVWEVKLLQIVPSCYFWVLILHLKHYFKFIVQFCLFLMTDLCLK